MARYRKPNYEVVNGKVFLECRSCHELKTPEPENFPPNRVQKRSYYPRDICHACVQENEAYEQARADKYWNRKGFIYFVQLLVDVPHFPKGTIKIGFSSDIESRVTTLGRYYFSVDCVGVIAGVFKDEHKMHSRFSHLRIYNEMFRPADDLLNYIEKHAEPSDAEYTMVKYRDQSA